LAVEIEIKAHVKDSEALKLLLSDKAQYLFSFKKEDTYYFPAGNPDIPKSGIRLRAESRTFPGGTEKETVYVTYKTKEVRDDIEINDENEFEIYSRQNGAILVFDKFLKMMGLRPGYSKRKKGWTFSKDGINAELMEVEKLGWFLELEIILDDIEAPDSNGAATAVIDEKRKQLMGFLSSLGIEKDAIESRYYSEMLKEAGKLLADNARLEQGGVKSAAAGALCHGFGE
jgi:adenylate cyclase class 2